MQLKTWSDASPEAVEAWYNNDGAEFLKALGIQQGDRVLDFGCGFGGYTIPLAQAVAPAGRVIAVDKNAKHLKALQVCLAGVPQACLSEYDGRQASLVETHLTDGRVVLDWMPSHSLDAALLFDVLQHIDDWDSLFSELSRVLKPTSHLYINPSSLSHPGLVDVDRMRNRLEQSSFRFARSLRARVMHFDSLCDEEILVFRSAGQGRRQT